jgi:uncharacterized RDD family membrane protein YckC
MTHWGDKPNDGSSEPDPWNQQPEQPDPSDQQPPPAQPDPWAQQPPPAQPDPWAQQPPPPAAQPDPWAQPPPVPPYGQPQAPQYGQPQQPYGQPGYGQAPAYGQPGAYPAAPGYSQYGQPTVTGTGVPAGMGYRLLARIIDWLIVGIPLGIIGAATNNSQLWSLIEIVVWLAYVGYLNGTQQQTIGKKVLGIKVVDEATGGPIGIGRAILRDVVLGITGLLCLIGYFSPFFDSTKRYQGWHDKAAKDFVISAR